MEKTRARARLAGLSLAVALFSLAVRAENLQEIYDLTISSAPQMKAAEANFKAGKEALPQAEVVTIDGAGHRPEVEKKDAFVAAVKKILS